MADAHDLAPRLRKADVEEVRAHQLEPLDALLGGLLGSKTWTITLDDKPISMFGVGPHHDLANTGIVWLLASPEVTLPGVKRQLLHDCRVWIDRMNDEFPILTNLVDARNTVHVRWLQWLGCIFINKHQIGAVPFYEFIRIKPCAHGQQSPLHSRRFRSAQSSSGE